MGYDRAHKGPGPRKFINSHKIEAKKLDFYFLIIVFFAFCSIF
jgi:hypothetical protein